MTLNYPVGELLDQGLELAGSLQSASFVSKFFGSSFVGYVVVTLEGFSGLEEGVLFFREGFAVGAAYSFDAYDVAIFGDQAMSAFLNALSAQRAVADSVHLTKQQVDLVLALDQRTAVSRPWSGDGLEKKIPVAYNPAFAMRAAKGLTQVITPASDIMKKIGLGELSK